MIGKVSCRDEVVLDDKGCFLGVENEALDHLCGDDALLRVQETEILSVCAKAAQGTTYKVGSSIRYTLTLGLPSANTMVMRWSSPHESVFAS